MTRRNVSSPEENLKKEVDNEFINKLEFRAQGLKGDDKALTEGPPIHINEDVWQEFLTVARVLYHVDSESDIYDVFNFMRVHFNSGQPFSEGILNRVDSEIARELGPWND